MKKSVLAVALLSSLAAPAFANEAGDWIGRVGGVVVAPDEGGEAGTTAASLTVDNDTQLGLTVGYMFTDNISVEVLAASPFSHTITLDGVGDIGETKHLPPTVMAQYYFGAADDAFRPYVGAGLNYTVFFQEELNSAVQALLNTNDLKLTSSLGLAVNAGVNYQINDDWFVSGSVWWADINTDVEVAGAYSGELELDPMVYLLTVGTTF